MAPSENNPVVLIHGWAGSFAETWRAPGIDALLEDAGKTVVGIDLLGHGEAEKPHDPEAYADLPAWLLARLADVPGRLDAVGFSLGALTLLRAVVASPDRFGKVLLAGIGDGSLGESDGANQRRIVAALEGRAADDDTAAHALANHARGPGKDLAALTAAIKRPAPPPLDPAALASIDNEVLVVIGDKDFGAPADALAAAFPRGKLVVLRNVDHFATPSDFGFIDSLLDFLGA